MRSFGLYGDSSEPMSQGMVHGTRNEMLSVLIKVFTDWEPSNMSWPINYGLEVSTAAASIAGPLFVHRFRSILKMGSGRGRLLTMAVSIFGPAALSGVMHREYIISDLLLQETKCPVCLETRAMSMQVGIGSILPLSLAYVGTMTFAIYDNLRWVPKGASNWLSFTRKTMPKAFPVIVGVTIFQAVVAAGLVSLQVDSRDKVIAELDRRMGLGDNRRMGLGDNS